MITLISLSIKFALGYSPLDFSVLDPHYGTLQEWQNAIDAIHAHNMYLMVDFTVGTMGDLLGFQGCVMVNSAFEEFCLRVPDF